MLLAASLLCLTSCLVTDYACGDHQVISEGRLLSCQCEPGYVLGPDGYGCLACAENEIVSTAGKCECKAGYTRNAMTGACDAIEGSYAGKPCSDSEPCGAPVTYCAVTETTPYCTTSGCTRNGDCPADWRCRQAGGQSFCASPPSGLGKPCTMQSDCAGYEASYCEIIAAHACIINNCLSNPSDCPSGSSCCDLTALNGQSLCVIDSALANGLCPGGKPPVTQ